MILDTVTIIPNPRMQLEKVNSAEMGVYREMNQFRTNQLTQKSINQLRNQSTNSEINQLIQNQSIDSESSKRIN